ncbi:MAG: DNA polymerase I [Anaerolineae bacterium]|nr:DNA polymerase I [Anaerolineae bacterium]
MAPKLLLIDGHSLVFRAFYATAHTGDIMATSSGEWTNAVYVFANKLLQMLRDQAPDYVAVAFDRGRTFRHDAYPEYKANRSRAPDELRVQLGRVEQLIGAFNIPAVSCEGYEADDVLGTLARQATQQGIDTVILTGDTDMLQLVDEHVQVLLPRGRYGDETLYGPDEVSERYGGLAPKQLIDHKALTGDSSDNIPGLRGIGDKTATSLLQSFGSIDGVYDHLEEITGKRPRAALEGGRDDVLLYKDLVTIRCDAPVSLDTEQARIGNYSREQVVELFRELEFHSLIDRVPAGEERAQDEREAESTPGSEVPLRYVTVDRLEHLQELVERLRTAPAFAFDTETTSTDPMLADLVGISVAVAPGRAWYIPVGHGVSRRRPEPESGDLSDLPLFADQEGGVREQEAAPTETSDAEPQLPLATVVAHLRPFFENREVAKYAHNASFDIEVLAQTTGITVRGLSFDTMIAAWVLDPGSRSIGLKAQAFTRLGIEMTQITDLIGSGKSQLSFDRVPVADAAPYACADADMTFRLVEPLKAELRKLHQWELFAEIEMPMVPILVGMEMTGVRLDADVLKEMSAELDESQRQIERQIYELVGHEFNINSTKQLSEVLFDELGLPKQGIRKTTHGYSTAADVLELLRRRHPVIELILDQRQISKLKSTYVDALPALINPRTGRVHTSYNQTGAVTGRLSSSNPNLQNIPIRTELGRQIRKAFVPREGWLFLAADYSQIELRVLAHVSQDAALLDAFHRNQDVHARTAAAVYGIAIDAVTKQQRAIAKTVNFGLIYGQSAYGLAQQTDLDYDEAERFIETYFAKYPGVKAWLEKTRVRAQEDGYVETLLGRRRYFPELQGTRRAYAGQRAAAARQAINAPIQGTAADILKIAMIRLEQGLGERRLQGCMVLQVHDEVVLEVPQEEIEEVAALTRDVMEHAYALSVPLRVDMEVGANWFDMQPV